jgi:hypothetical protein
MASIDNPACTRFDRLAACTSTCLLLLLLAGCAGNPSVTAPDSAAAVAGDEVALAYYQRLQRMTPTQISRERSVLAAAPQTPDNQVRMAMVLGYPRGQPDLAKAINSLDGVLKASEPGAVKLHPLARLLADGFLERQRLETQLDRQGQQLKDSQRKAVELQEKIDSLADIERTLPQRPRALPPVGGAR